MIDNSYMKGMTPMTRQEAYCQYLHEWADSHSSIGFEGCCPACFDEWADNERQEIESTLTDTYFFQVKYLEQDNDIQDTVALHLPDTVTEADLYDAIQTLVCKYGDGKYEDEDMLDLTDEMIDELVSMWNGAWSYMPIHGTMEVNGYVRSFHRG